MKEKRKNLASNAQIDYGTMDNNQVLNSKSDLTMNNNPNQNSVSLILSEEDLNKIFSKYISQIENINISIKLSKIFSFLSIVASFILLSIKLSKTGNKFSWLYLNIPVIISILLIFLVFDMYLYLKSLIEKVEKNSMKFMNMNKNNNEDIINTDINNIPPQSERETANEIKNTKNGGTIFTYVILFLITFCLICFSLLVTFYLQEVVITQAKDAIFVFLPLFVAVFLLLIYIIFITPAFKASNLYIELGLIYLNIVSFSAFLILLCLKINNKLNHNGLNGLKFSYVFIPFYFLIGANMAYLVLNKAVFGKNKKNQNQNFISGNSSGDGFEWLINLFSLVPILVAGILTNLKLDDIMTNKNNYIQSILVLAGYLIFMSTSLWEILVSDNIDENN